jgi:VanZ family protein
MLVFIPWTFLYSIGSRFQNKMLNIVLGISFAVISEGFQFFIPYRAFNVNDAVANSAGVILGSTQWLFKRRN